MKRKSETVVKHTVLSECTKKRISMRTHMTGLMLSVVFCMLMSVSCSFPFQSEAKNAAQISDISARLTFTEIVHQGFMGGSVLYNPDKPSSGQLAKGVSLAIRLGTVEKNEVSAEQAVFTDMPDLAQFGKLYVTDIDTKFISFDIQLFDSKGNTLGGSSYRVHINEGVDVNSDGLTDIEYKKPIRKRSGFETAIYLTFVSSQETLNTAMFAVLPEQYSRSVYPSGIIGINPQGRFIVRKYEADNATRSMVYGLQKGDYVLDNISGAYYPIKKTKNSIVARIIDDRDLVTQSNFDIDSFYYSEYDFNEYLTPCLLLKALPSTLISEYTEITDSDAIQKLNIILRDENLVKNISAYYNEILDDEVIAVLNNTSSLTEYELVSFNRFYLDDRYQDISPQIDTGTTDITEILPLYSCIIGENEKSVENNIRITTYSEYESAKIKIEEKFSRYSKLKLVDDTKEDIIEYLFSKRTGDVDVRSTVNVQLGIAGSFSISFSNIDINLSTVLYMKSESLASLKKSFSKSLLPGGKSINLNTSDYPIPCGPAVTLYVSCPVTIDIPISVGGSMTISSDMFAGFVGLYGVVCNIGANYGMRWVQWFKVWSTWVYRPDVYFNSYSSAYSINESAYYVGPQSSGIVNNNLIFENAFAYLSINPYIFIGPKIRWTMLSASVEVRAGIDNRLDIDIKKDKLNDVINTNGIAKINLTLGLSCTPAIELNLPFGIGKKKLQTTFNLIPQVNKTLSTWRVF